MSPGALRRDLATIAQKLGRDELHVLVTLATRAWAGQGRYGCLDLRQDRRDFQHEAAEELVDGLFYLAVDLLRRHRPSRRTRSRTTPRPATAAALGRRGEMTKVGLSGRHPTRCHLVRR